MTTTQPVKIGKGWEGEVKIVSKEKPFYTVVPNSELLQTKDYSKFKCDIKNRPVSDDKVAFFVKQFSAGKFFMKEFPVIVDKDMVILDGQHRYEASKKLDMSVYFRFADSLTIDSVTDVQVNAGWKTEDYIHAFIQQKNQNYIILNRFIKRYKITTSVACILLSGGTQHGSLAKLGFYDGTFVVKNEDKAHELAGAINEYGSMALNLNRDKAFCIAIVKILEHPEFDEKRMKSQLSKYVSLIKRQVTTEGYLRNLEEVYNYHLFTKNKIRFI